MRSLLLLVTLLAAFHTTLASPHRRQETNAGFSLAASKGSGGNKDFVQDFATAKLKWGKVDVASTFSLSDDSDDIVEVDPLPMDSIYIADVEIGNPPQTLKLAIDTGSADLWVQSSDTIYHTNFDGPWAPQYKPNMSKTAHHVRNAEWDVQYMDNSAANGIVYLDTLRMGGFELHDVPVQSAKTVVSRFETETNLTGIMGLAKTLPSNIEPLMPTLLDKLRPVLDEPVFTVDLNFNATGYFNFGRIDKTRAKDNFTWMETNPGSPHWDVMFDLTRWSGSHQNTWWRYEFNATIDTGTTLLFLPSELASMYWFDVPGMKVDPRVDDAYTFPCDIADGLPDLMFKLPGTEHVLTIPGPYLNYGPVKGIPGTCWGGMQSAEDMEVTIFGDVFLKALLVAFDIDTHKVGFANKKLDDDED
ncbi:Fc.00g028800.m01.CDS01 [Cosmosporella sp. VM-42]